MGTASTMASLMEGLGLALPHNAALPAVDARRQTLAHMTGRRIVEMVKEDITPSKLLDKRSFENAIMLNAAIGGSTNAIVHLLAIAGRLGIDLKLEDFQRCGRDVPLLVNLMPSGRFDGRLLLCWRRPRCSEGNRITIAHRCQNCLWNTASSIDDAECFNRDVIKTVEAPVQDKAGITVLKGNLAPRGAIIKPSAATAELLVHRGRAVVFESIEDYKARVDDPNLEVDRLPSWFSKAVVQGDIPECQKLETWDCRLRSLNKESPIWFGYPTLECLVLLWYSRSPRGPRVVRWWSTCDCEKWRLD